MENAHAIVKSGSNESTNIKSQMWKRFWQQIAQHFQSLTNPSNIDKCGPKKRIQANKNFQACIFSVLLHLTYLKFQARQGYKD